MSDDHLFVYTFFARITSVRRTFCDGFLKWQCVRNIPITAVDVIDE